MDSNNIDNTDPEALNYFPEQDNDYSDVSSETAASLIGGASVVSSHHNDDQTTTQREAKLDHNNVTSKDIENHQYRNEHKIFTFSLPLGGNPLAHLPSIRSLKLSLPIIGDSDAEVTSPLHISRHEIKSKLKRQESITTLEEEYLFNDLKGSGNPRFRAMKRALTPSINIPSLTEDKNKVESVWDQFDGEVVIMGGYRGSVLKEKGTGSKVWIPSVSAGLNIKKVNLLIGPSDEDEELAQKEIYSNKMLSHVGPVDISKKLMTKLNNGKAKVHNFGYDWRLSSDINSAKLYKFLTSLQCNKGPNKRGALIIAHSMGGLVAHHAMMKDPSLVLGMIYAGCPAKCPNVLGPIRYGDSVMFSTKILTAEVNFFMRSSFVFLPEDGRCFVDKKTHEKYNLDYFDPDNWVKYNLSPCVSQSRKKEANRSVSTRGDPIEPIRSPTLIRNFESFDMKRSLSLKSSSGSKLNGDEMHSTFQQSYDYLSRTLKRTKKFLQELEYDPDVSYPPLAIVYGNEIPTVRGARVEGLGGIQAGDYDDFYYGPGDGVVHHKWLMPEQKGFPVVAKLASAEGHVSLMSDLNTMGDAITAILDEEKARKSFR